MTENIPTIRRRILDVPLHFGEIGLTPEEMEQLRLEMQAEYDREHERISRETAYLAPDYIHKRTVIREIEYGCLVYGIKIIEP